MGMTEFERRMIALEEKKVKHLEKIAKSLAETKSYTEPEEKWRIIHDEGENNEQE